jgi:hypothetical protein
MDSGPKYLFGAKISLHNHFKLLDNSLLILENEDGGEEGEPFGFQCIHLHLNLKLKIKAFRNF